MDDLIYHNFLENVQEAMWIIDMDFKYIYLNEAYKKCHLVKQDIVGETLLELNIECVAKEFMEKFKIILNEKKTVIFELDLREKTYKIKIFPMMDDKGYLKMIGGLLTDITDKVIKEKENLYHRNLLQNVIDGIPEIIFSKDLEGRYQFINKTCRIFHKQLGLDDVIGKTDIEINPNKKVGLKVIDTDKAILKNMESITVESRIRSYNNKISIMESMKSPLISEHGDLIGIVGISRDITKKKSVEENLKYMSYTDTLTGIYNRAGFERKIEELKNTTKMPLGLIMGDVNGLKLVNDTFGHVEGDKLLVSIASVLRGVCGNYGEIFRWGGDEFIILVPNAYVSICESIINNIKNEFTERSLKGIELSMSMGWSIFGSPDDDINEILKIAEDKVYKHKLLEQKNILGGTINLLQETLDAKSLETKEHMERIITMSVMLGTKMKLSQAQLEELEEAAKLHDIGKIGIDEDVLLKPGALTEAEYNIIKTHTEKGYRIVMASSGLEGVAKTVLTHHERWDGLGYPLGLKRKEIPLASRIISIVDAYDAMTNDRIYRGAIKKEEAIREIEKSKGTQFDPTITTLFIQMMNEMLLDSIYG